MRAKLSDDYLGARAFQPGKRTIVHDVRLPGFHVVIGAHTKTFRLRTRRVNATLGRWPLLSAQEARLKAIDLLRRIEAGEELRPRRGRMPEVQPAPAAPTLRAVITDYTTTKQLKPRTAKDYAATVRLYAPDWLDAPVTGITPPVFEAAFRAIGKPAAANLFARIVSALVNFASTRHGLSLVNPVTRLRALDGLHEVKPRDRLVPDRQQGAWSAAVVALDDRDAADALRFLALTGCRLGEALRLTWADVDLAAGTVRFRETKNGSDHVLPLGLHLRALLAARRASAGSGAGAVFPVPEARLRAAVGAVVKASGVAFSPHDLRRGFVTTAQRELRDLATVKRLVNHAAGGDVTTKHYLRLSVDDLCAPMQRVEAAFLRLWSACT